MLIAPHYKAISSLSSSPFSPLSDPFVVPGIPPSIQEGPPFLESLRTPSESISYVEHLLHALREDWFGLRGNVSSVICVLCQRFPEFLNALRGRESEIAFAEVLEREEDRGVVLNILSVIGKCGSIFQRDVFEGVARIFDECLAGEDESEMMVCCAEAFGSCLGFGGEGSRELVSEIARRYGMVVERRIRVLYPHIASFAEQLVNGLPESDEGLRILLDAGFLHVFVVFHDDSGDVSLLPAILSLLSGVMEDTKGAVFRVVSEMPDLAAEFVALFLDRRVGFSAMAQGIECYRRLGLVIPDVFHLIERTEVLSALAADLRGSHFELRLAAGSCVCASISKAGPRMARTLFASRSRILIETLSLFEYDSPALLSELLRTMGMALESVHSFGLLRYSSFDEFEGLFAKTVQRMMVNESEMVREAAADIATVFFPELKYGGHWRCELTLHDGFGP
jgi:hypothetical protein